MDILWKRTMNELSNYYCAQFTLRETKPGINLYIVKLVLTCKPLTLS